MNTIKMKKIKGKAITEKTYKRIYKKTFNKDSAKRFWNNDCCKRAKLDVKGKILAILDDGNYINKNSLSFLKKRIKDL